MGFPPEAVAIAYDKTILKCHELKWAYCNGILKRWHAADVHTVDEIEEKDRPAKKPEKRTPVKDSKDGADVAWMRKYIKQRDKEN